MTLIIAGTRTMHRREAYAHIGGVWPETEERIGRVSRIITGVYGGVDMAGKEWAERNDIPFDGFPAAWTRYGRAAGPLRNAEMAKAGDALLLIWDGRSRGSRDMRGAAMRHGLPVLSMIVPEGLVVFTRAAE